MSTQSFNVKTLAKIIGKTPEELISDLKQLDGWLTRKVMFDVSKASGQKVGSVKTSRKYSISSQGAVKNKIKKDTSPKPSKVGANLKSQYTIQLFAAMHRSIANQFAATKAKGMKGLRVVKKGKLYKVYYGNFSTQKMAEAARKKLPATMKQHHPWVVSTS